ncbi:hypothetical protein DYB36_009336, partial [Aphanomyces astaci]
TALFKLKTLHLHGNTITRIDNLKTCRHLTYLDLSRNRIAGAWSNTLRVDRNKFADLSTLPLLPNLNEFYAHGNLLTDIAAVVSRMPQVGQAKTSEMGTDPLDGIPIRPPTSHGSTREGEIQTTEGGSTSFVTMLQVDDEKDDKGLGVRDMVVEPSALKRPGTSYEDAMKLHLASALKAEDIEVEVGGEGMKEKLAEELPRVESWRRAEQRSRPSASERYQSGIGRFRLMSTKEPSMTPAKKHPAVAVVAGAIAGGIEMCSIWPMEMIKTNLQLGTMKSHYTKMLPGFRYHIQTGGVLSLYRGLAPVLVGSLPKAGLRFGAFDSIKQLLADEHGKSTPLRNLAAGMSAGAIEAILVTTPTETVKTKLIDANTGMLHGIKRILETDGIRGLYQGLTATIMKQATNTGLRFMWFSEYKARVPDLLARNDINYDTLSPGELAIVSFVGGMTAGIFSTFGNNRTSL